MDSLTLIVFFLAGWLGLYLIARNNHPRLLLTGVGLLAYALLLGLQYTTAGEIWERINWALRLLPPLLWAGAILYIDDRIAPRRSLLLKIWMWILLPISLLGGLSIVLGFD